MHVCKCPPLLLCLSLRCFLETESLTETWSPWTLARLVSMLQCSSHLWSQVLSTGAPGLHGHLRLFCRCCGRELRFLCLHSKSFHPTTGHLSYAFYSYSMQVNDQTQKYLSDSLPLPPSLSLCVYTILILVPRVYASVVLSIENVSAGSIHIW